MTRINVIPEELLTKKHLEGEYHEISRVFNLVRKAVASGKSPSDIKAPDSYTLGRGHVLFFYDKLAYISERYLRLGLEIRYRNGASNLDLGKALKLIIDAREDIPDEWWGDYSPTKRAQIINKKRIKERL